VLVLALALIAAGVSFSAALAGRVTPREQPTPTAVAQIDEAPLSGGQAPGLSGGPATSGGKGCAVAFQYIIPGPAGPCNGCEVRPGERFDLDLMLHAAGKPVVSQQTYLTFTTRLLQSVDPAGGGCYPAAALQPDTTVFDAVLQNEVCSGDAPCDFRGLKVDGGSIAYASGALSNPAYSGDDFRLARMSFCALAPGDAMIRWQFAPANRATFVNEAERDAAAPCYLEYVIHIAP
jgi:hypothetical protein